MKPHKTGSDTIPHALDYKFACHERSSRWPCPVICPKRALHAYVCKTLRGKFCCQIRMQLSVLLASMTHFYMPSVNESFVLWITTSVNYYLQTLSFHDNLDTIQPLLSASHLHTSITCSIIPCEQMYAVMKMNPATIALHLILYFLTLTCSWLFLLPYLCGLCKVKIIRDYFCLCCIMPIWLASFICSLRH